MAFGKDKEQFVGRKVRQNYDYNTRRFAEERTIESNLTTMTLNNSISFNSQFKFKCDHKTLRGQEYFFTLFVTKDKEYAKSIEDEEYLKDKFIWDEFYYDNRNVKVL